MKQYASFIQEYFKDKNVELYIDKYGFGIGLLDELLKLNIENLYVMKPMENLLKGII